VGGSGWEAYSRLDLATISLLPFSPLLPYCSRYTPAWI
jgi:hypothetical protein